jgi:hypothetical protein
MEDERPGFPMRVAQTISNGMDFTRDSPCISATTEGLTNGMMFGAVIGVGMTVMKRKKWLNRFQRYEFLGDKTFLDATKILKTRWLKRMAVPGAFFALLFGIGGAFQGCRQPTGPEFYMDKKLNRILPEVMGIKHAAIEDPDFPIELNLPDGEDVVPFPDYLTSLHNLRMEQEHERKKLLDEERERRNKLR